MQSVQVHTLNLSFSAPGWFEQRCPFVRVFTYKQNHRDGTKQLYGVRPMRFPMQPAVVSEKGRGASRYNTTYAYSPPFTAGFAANPP